MAMKERLLFCLRGPFYLAMFMMLIAASIICMVLAILLGPFIWVTTGKNVFLHLSISTFERNGAYASKFFTWIDDVFFS